MPVIADADIERMRANLLFDGDDRQHKLSKFWVLLVLAACIASAGVVGDSTATVIGAMIVAPLMTPIMGTVLSIVTSDRANLIRSLAMIVGGALTAIAIGYLFGVVAPVDVIASTSSQVAARVDPKLIDLIAAIATGAAGAFAQCRADVSDTLPGVAIAISLVPPLTVVGLTLEGGEPEQSLGALLLFVTNVAAILLTGVIVMAVFRIHQRAVESEGRVLNRRRAIEVVVVMVLVIAVPLAVTTKSITQDSVRSSQVATVATKWARESDWTLTDVRREDGVLNILVTGALPGPDPAELRTALDEAGLDEVGVVVHLVPEERVTLAGT
jgi:uncharacterized hydrophobic protein (TIGR00271 family)